MSQAHIWQEEIIEANNSIKVSAIIELANGSQKLLWYGIPVQYRDCLTTNCDPFAIATIFFMMNQELDVRIHGEVSPSLLANLEEFQNIWSSWRSQKYKRIKITADTEKEFLPKKSEEVAISAFSGGVDSCFTAFRHRTGRCGRQKCNLQTGLMVHGFDIPLKDQIFEKALVKSNKMLNSLAMECIPVATNFRQVIKLNWEEVFGTALASCFHLFKAGYTKGIIPSSHAYRTLNIVYGSNPLSDRFLSSKYFEIVHDGALFTRLEKMRDLIEWNEALENLRVCWQGVKKDRNCGRCEKCVRNILNFRILGVDLPACFEKDVTNQQITRLKVRGTSLEIWETLLANAKAQKINKSWVKAIQIAIIKNKIKAWL